MQYHFLFEAGQFKPFEVFPPTGKVTNLDDQLRDAGYVECQTFGDTCGTHFDLHERDVADTGREWLVVFGTPFSWSLIACRTWPDLFELLAKLSSIALAASAVPVGDRR